MQAIAELLAAVAGSRISFVSKATASKLHRASPELVAVLSLGVTILLAVLGQAAWLDGKIERGDARLAAQIERVDAKLAAQIESLHAGQTAIRERLAALEPRAGALEPGIGVGGARAAGSEQSPGSTL